MANKEPQTPLSREELFKLFRESGEPNFQVFLDEYIEWVYPEQEHIQ